MATPNTIITTALRHLGVLDAVSNVSGDDAAHCLELLRSMLDALQLDPQATTGLQELVYTPTSGTTSFTIGPSGAIVAAQPARIVKAVYRINNIDYPVDVVNVEDYAEFSLKSERSNPSCIALNRSTNTATVYLFPAAEGSAQLRLWVANEVVSGFTSMTLTTTLTLPNGYQNFLEWGLAEEAAPSYVVPEMNMQRVLRQAGIARRRMKRANVRVPQLEPLQRGQQYDIQSDSYR